MSKSSLQSQASLLNTKWLVKGTKGRFTPFYVTFKENGKADVVTINNYFSGEFDWSEEGSHFQLTGNYDSEPGVNYHLLGSYENETGSGHYIITSSSGKQLGGFTMIEQMNG